MVEFDEVPLIAKGRCIRKSQPVERGTGSGRKLVALLEKGGNRTEPRRVNDIQLTIVHERIPDKPAVTVRASRSRIVGLALENRPAQGIRANLRSEQFAQIASSHERGGH